MIIIDYISGNYSYWKQFKMTRILQENSFSPKNIEELLQIIIKKKRLDYNSKDVLVQQKKFCDLGSNQPSVLRLVLLIKDFTEKNTYSKKFYINNYVKIG